MPQKSRPEYSGTCSPQNSIAFQIRTRWLAHDRGTPQSGNTTALKPTTAWNYMAASNFTSPLALLFIRRVIFLKRISDSSAPMQWRRLRYRVRERSLFHTTRCRKRSGRPCLVIEVGFISRSIYLRRLNGFGFQALYYGRPLALRATKWLSTRYLPALEKHVMQRCTSHWAFLTHDSLRLIAVRT